MRASRRVLITAGVVTTIGASAGAAFAATAPANTASPSTARAGTASPGTALPNTALPNTALPNTALPNTALPNTALPNTAHPNTAPASTATPSATRATTEASTSASSVPACRTTQLDIWRAEPGNGTTGGTYYELEFSNVSTSTCSLRGYAHVVAVNNRGAQLGSAAAHDPTFAPSTVVLGPRTTAHAVLRVSDAGVFSAASCHPTAAAGVNVAPPGRSRAAFVPLSFTACSSQGPVILTVRVVRSRVGIPGVSE